MMTEQTHRLQTIRPAGAMSPETSPLLHLSLGKRIENRSVEPTNKMPQDNGHGLTFWPAVFVVTGLMSGYTTSILVTSFISTGWLGFMLYIGVALQSVYAATLLGSCCNMLDRETHCDDGQPFGTIAYEACGQWARITINGLIGVVIFGGGSVMLLLVSDLLYIIIGPFAIGTYCYWPLAFGVIICPVMWLRTPKDIWQAAALGTMSLVLAFILLTLRGVSQISESPAVPSPTPTDWGLSLMTASTMFAIFVHFAIPTIHQDMVEPSQINKCLVTGYAINCGMIAFVLIVSYFAFGHLVSPETAEQGILYFLPHDGLLVVTSVFFLINGLLLQVPANNPLFQQLEELFQIRHDSCWQRVALRTSVVISQIFLAETMPNFSVLMSLVSCIFIPPITFFAPALFYLRLRRTRMADDTSRHPFVYTLETIACVTMMGACPVVIVVTTAANIMAVAKGETLFVSPCYVNVSAGV